LVSVSVVHVGISVVCWETKRDPLKNWRIIYCLAVMKKYPVICLIKEKNLLPVEGKEYW